MSPAIRIVQEIEGAVLGPQFQKFIPKKKKRTRLVWLGHLKLMSCFTSAVGCISLQISAHGA